MKCIKNYTQNNIETQGLYLVSEVYKGSMWML
jgi:hypothetical protein